MFVKMIKWIDVECKEAEVIVSDGVNDILCFSCPFNKKSNDILDTPIYCLNVEDIVVSDKKVAHSFKNDTAFGYSICARLISNKNKLVSLGGIVMCLEDAHIPADISDGSFIEFKVSRLDLY